VGEPNPRQLDRYIENGAFWRHHFEPDQLYFKHANKGYLEAAVKLGLIDKADQIVLHLYCEPLQKFRNAARGLGPIQAPEVHRARIEAHFDPLPIWYPTFEGTQIAADEFPLHAITQRPMQMYHSWGSQNAWLRQILNRSPSQIDALQLLTLIRLERGEAGAAETQVKGVYGRLIKPEPKPEALGVGLLLAELQQKRNEASAAELTYQELALAFPQDQRPLIGLALLRHSRGQSAGALEALQQARRRSPDPGKADPRLDALAATWGLEKLRATQGASPGPKPPGAPQQTEAKPPTAPQPPAL
jgi:hypothetical protein